MSLTGVVGAVAVSFVLASVGASGPPPSELALDRIAGFSLTDGPTTDLDGPAYARSRPESVSHLEPDAGVLDGLLATLQTWSGDGATVLVEVVRAADEGTATGFVDQAAANSIAVGLAPTDPVFGGVWSYSGTVGEEDVAVVAWSQGQYAVTMTLTGPAGTAAAGTGTTVLDAAAVRQAEIILDRTGAAVSVDAIVDEEAPVPPTDGTTAPPDSDEDDDEAPALPVGGLALVVLAAVVVVGVGWRARGGRP